MCPRFILIPAKGLHSSYSACLIKVSKFRSSETKMKNEGIYRSTTAAKFCSGGNIFPIVKWLCSILTLACLQIKIVPELSGRKPGPITACTAGPAVGWTFWLVILFKLRLYFRSALSLLLSHMLCYSPSDYDKCRRLQNQSVCTHKGTDSGFSIALNVLTN